MEKFKKQEQNQKQIWNKIAKSWSSYEFKQKPFPDVEKFLKQLKKFLNKNNKDKILEVGCGNCRNLAMFRNKAQLYGIDFSAEMIKQAKQFTKQHKFKVNLQKADATKLPFKNNEFNIVLCVAVLHCLKKIARKKALQEIKRVLKKRKGKALISVWNKPRYYGKEKSIGLATSTNKNKKIKRYYYFYSPDKLRNLLQEAGFKILKSKQGKNLIFLVERQ